MQAYPASVVARARQPSGLIPIVLSLCALVVVIGTVSMSGGGVRQPDEGAAAHLFQLLVASEAPVLVFFALRWLRKDVKAWLGVLTVQAVALALALFPVWYLGL